MGAKLRIGAATPFGQGYMEVRARGTIFGKQQTVTMKLVVSSVADTVQSVVKDVVVPFLNSLKYDRGWGMMPHCKSGQDQVLVVCYASCPRKYINGGVICIER